MIRIKVCGLRSSKDAQLATDLGAWALGFIFQPKSPRYIHPRDVRTIATEIKPSPQKVEPLKVGVFVDAGLPEVFSAAKIAKLDVVQLHGDETPEYCAELKETAPELKIIKAFRLQETSVLPDLGKYSACNWFLIDSFSKDRHGGTGQTAPWALAQTAAKSFPVLLAGGIGEENLAEAIQKVKPFAIDLSSWLEAKPGVKDPAKMKSFFEAARKVTG